MISLIIHSILLIKKKMDEWRAIEKLHKLSDRELRDIGVTRYDIEHKVKHGN
jgi:uncharacterized protein YjiS (DUF1127 family)